jgi:quinolinate synthase
MHKQKLIERLRLLKEKYNAVILVHNYQLPEVQDIADFMGDSLELSRIAANLKNDVIVFCGVHFMAETAAILSPDKKVIIPDLHAGCPMADMVTASDIRKLRKEHPRAVIVAYVNTSAEVKAEVDVCCTSANAVKIVAALKDAPEVIFVPDKHLAQYVSIQLKRKMIIWNGFCPTHVRILPEDIKAQKKLHPKAKVLVHPECRTEIIELADAVYSTSGICKAIKESNDKEFIIGTENSLIYRLQKENPGKKFYPASSLIICPNMKQITLEKVVWALEGMQYEIKIPEDMRLRAKKSVDEMVKMV